MQRRTFYLDGVRLSGIDGISFVSTDRVAELYACALVLLTPLMASAANGNVIAWVVAQVWMR